MSEFNYQNNNNNNDGFRPESLTVKLFANGEATEKVVTLNEENEWTATFEELLKYSEAKEIVYTVGEKTVEGYTTTVDDFIITNIHAPEKTQVHVVKVWDDKDDKDKLRPESITVHLYADDVKVATALVTAENGWTYDFTGLDKYKENGKQIIYTLSEDEVEGYTTKIEGNVITNTHKVKVVQTGDNTDISLWVSSMIISLLGMVFMTRRKEEEQF